MLWCEVWPSQGSADSGDARARDVPEESMGINV